MTVAAAAAKAGPYTGNNVASSFAFAFKVFADTDVRVVETLISTSVETDLVLNTDYTVTRNADQDTTPGGLVTYKVAGVTTALPSTKTLTIIGDFPFEQPTDIPNGGPFFAAVVETALDRIEMHVKQLKEAVDRAVKTGVSSSTDPDSLVNALLAASAAATTAAAEAAASAAAAEAAVPSGSLGYTPVNKVGDTMTGNLAVPGINVGGSGVVTSLGNAATKATGSAAGNVPLVGTESATEVLAGLSRRNTQAEAEAGSLDAGHMTPLKTAQAIAASLSLGTVTSPASGTAIDYTGISPTAKRITVMFSELSTNGSDNVIVQLGTSSGPETSGYKGGSFNASTTVVTANGFDCSCQNNAVASVSGQLTLTRITSTLWSASGVFCTSGAGGYVASVGGSKNLSGTLDRLRVTTTAGTASFDSGIINVLVE